MKFVLATVAAMGLAAPAFAEGAKTATPKPVVSTQGTGLLLGGLGGAGAGIAIVATIAVVGLATATDSAASSTP